MTKFDRLALSRDVYSLSEIRNAVQSKRDEFGVIHTHHLTSFHQDVMPSHIFQAIRAHEIGVLPHLALLLMSAIHSPGANVNENVDIFILGGQSNMAGRGGVHYYPNGTKVFDGEGPEPDPRVLCYNAAKQWVEAKEPMHADIDTTKVNGVGPGLIFAKELFSLGYSGASRIGLVPCAVGGSSMDDWLPGSLLYDKMLNRALKAVESFPSSSSSTVRLKGLLWFQGESDTNSSAAVESFPSKLSRFFHTFWCQIDSPQDFIIQQAQVTCLLMEGTKYLQQLRQAQLEVGAAMRSPDVWTVDTQGLSLKEDGLHLTRESQYKLGAALAQQHIAILANSTSQSAPWKCV